MGLNFNRIFNGEKKGLFFYVHCACRVSKTPEAIENDRLLEADYLQRVVSARPVDSLCRDDVLIAITCTGLPRLKRVE